MATKPIRVCDVYETSRDVGRYRVTVDELDDDGNVKPDAVKYQAELDLCPRARRRLGAFLDKGITPPKGKKAEATE